MLCVIFIKSTSIKGKQLKSRKCCQQIAKCAEGDNKSKVFHSHKTLQLTKCNKGHDLLLCGMKQTDFVHSNVNAKS